MRVYFDEETDKKLLEAKNEDEIRAIIATTPEAEKLKDKIDLVMEELERIKSKTDEEVELDELENAAGGAKATKVYLSETVGCKSTFRLNDWHYTNSYCWRNDYCINNEYEYYHTKWADCPEGGKHNWTQYRFEYMGFRCNKCDFLFLAKNVDKYHFFDDHNSRHLTVAV